MEKIIKSLKSAFLDKQGLLKEIMNWKTLNFSNDWKLHNSQTKKGELIKLIRNKIDQGESLDFHTSCGVYAYIKNKQVLYIGKTAKLEDAIQRHYKEANDIGGNRPYRKFFGKYKKGVKIYFKEIDYIAEVGKKPSEALRIIIERILIASLNPKFEIDNPSKK